MLNTSKKCTELNGWWTKQISPIVSLIVLLIATITIFALGAVFVKEYVRIWTEIGERQHGIIYYPEKPGVLEKVILP